MRNIGVWVWLGILLFSVGSVLAAGSAGGQVPAVFGVVVGEDNRPEVAAELSRDLNGDDLKSWACETAKYGVGPLLAKTKALETAWKGVDMSSGAVNWKNYLLPVEEIMAREEKICGVQSGVEAVGELQDFYDLAVAGRDKFKKDFVRDFNVWAGAEVRDGEMGKADISELGARLNKAWASEFDVAPAAVKKIMESKRKLLGDFISGKLEQARELIKNSEVLKSGVLLEQSVNDEKDLMNILQNGDLNSERERQLKGIFENKWDFLRQQLEAAEALQPRAVVKQMLLKLRQVGVERDLSGWVRSARRNERVRLKNEERCANQEKNFAGKVSDFEKCVVCQSVASLPEQKAYEEFLTLRPLVEKALKMTRQAKAYRAPYEKLEAVEVENFKNELQKALDDFYRAREEYDVAYGAYEENINNLREACAYLRESGDGNNQEAK